MTTKPQAKLARSDGADEPLWKKIEMVLLRQIREGRFAGAERLPSENDLATQFGVNRHTARQAIAGLVQRGVIFKRKGGGSYLVPDVLEFAIGERTRFSVNLTRQGREPARTLLSFDERPVDGKVAAALQLKNGSRAIFLHLIGMADEIPITLTKTYMPAKRFPHFMENYQDSLSMTKALAHCGISDYKRDVTRCFARMPSPEDVRYLRQSESTPILAVESIDVDLEGRPIVYHETSYAGERVQIVFQRGNS
jgi:GntR family transcriptional regulator, phosphonate transport system regulatory protein